MLEASTAGMREVHSLEGAARSCAAETIPAALVWVSTAGTVWTLKALGQMWLYMELFQQIYRVCLRQCVLLHKTKKTPQEDRQTQSLYSNSVTKTVYVSGDPSGQRTSTCGETDDGEIFAEIGA